VRRKTWTTRAIVSAVSASIHCRLIHPPVAPTRMPSSQNGHETARPARICGKAVVLRSLRHRQERWRSQLGRTRPRPCMLRWHASWPHRRTRRLTAVSALQAQLGVRQARSKRAPRQVVPAGRRAAAPAAPCSPALILVGCYDDSAVQTRASAWTSGPGGSRRTRRSLPWRRAADPPRTAASLSAGIRRTMSDGRACRTGSVPARCTPG
jgi:hypothetical protein